MTGPTPAVTDGAPVDFEIEKIARVLARRRADAEIVVARRGRSITVHAVPGDAAGRPEAPRPVARLRDEGEGRFALDWARATGGWEEYGVRGTLDECLEEVRRDDFGCFWGP